MTWLLLLVMTLILLLLFSTGSCAQSGCAWCWPPDPELRWRSTELCLRLLVAVSTGLLLLLLLCAPPWWEISLLDLPRAGALECGGRGSAATPTSAGPERAWR